MDRLERFGDALSNAVMWCAVVTGFLMMVHVTADVFARNVLNAPLFGTTEIGSNYYMVAISYLPLAWIIKNEGHIIVELFTRNMTPAALFRLDTYVAIATFIYVAVLAVMGLENAIEQTEIFEQAESAWGFIAVWPARWLIVIGFGCFAIQALIQILVGFARMRKGGEKSSGAQGQ